MACQTRIRTHLPPSFPRKRESTPSAGTRHPGLRRGDVALIIIPAKAGSWVNAKIAKNARTAKKDKNLYSFAFFAFFAAFALNPPRKSSPLG
jgi:hypothetical protein